MNERNRVLLFLRGALLVAALPFLTGCFSFDLAIKVRPDGSGTIVETMAMKTDWIKDIAGMFEAMGGEQDKPKKRKDGTFEIFTVEEAKKKAAELGEGVRFVSAEPFQKNGFEGIRATYSFTDVTKLSLSDSPKPPLPGPPQDEKQKQDKMTLRFEKASPGKPASLAIQLADGDVKKETGKKTPPKEPETPPTKEELEQARKFIGGMRFGFTVEVDGTLVDTNSPFVEGKKITIFEMDFDKLLSDEKSIRKLSALDGKSLANARREFAGVPGFRIPPVDEVRIRFK